MTSNKAEARHLRTKSDWLLFRELLSKVDKVGAFSCLNRNKSCWDGWVTGIVRVRICAKNIKTDSINSNIRGTNIIFRFEWRDGATVTRSL